MSILQNSNSEINSNPLLKRADNSVAEAKSNSVNSSKIFSLKNKATLLAIALGVIPVATVGFLSLNILRSSVTKQIDREQLEETEIAADRVTQFLEDRLREIDAISKSAIFADAKLRDAMTLEEKTAVLNSFKDELTYFNSIVFFDPNGDPIFQAKSDSPNRKNYGGKKYFQEAVKTEKITINGPGISSSSGQLRVEFAAPVKDINTGELIGILRFKTPGNYIKDIFSIYEQQNLSWNLINDKNKIFAGDRDNHLNQLVSDHFSGVKQLHESRQPGVVRAKVSEENTANLPDLAANNSDTKPELTRKQLVSYVPAKPPARFPGTHIGVSMAKDEDIAFAPIRQLGWTLFIGTVVTALLVAAIASYLANRATLPILNTVAGVKKIGRGELDTRLAVTSNDEFGELNSNINLMTQQIQTSLQEQQALAEEQRQGKERLESAIEKLLNEVSDASDGDLTVRANLDSAELSTVADLFNAVIINLQDIAIEAKQSSDRVGSSLKQNEQAIRLLAEQAISEAQETRDTLLSVELMSQSIQAVSQNASQAEKITDDTFNTIVSSTKNMDLTVNSILELRNTVGETAKKMKRLGESSQKISQAVSFIEEIALRTNVLSINASVEAGRAGEYGQGFTIVAEQVGALAEQSAAATREITNIVAAIQAETQEVNRAMESGTTQVVETTRLVETTKQSLSQVLEKSQEINQLMSSISQTTISQADTSLNVTKLMQKIARLSETTSQSSAKVAESIVETAQVAAKLESTVGQFKVAE